MDSPSDPSEAPSRRHVPVTRVILVVVALGFIAFALHSARGSSPELAGAHFSPLAATAVVRPASRPPVKVFILAGQSNMQGHGYIDAKNEDGTFRNGTLEQMVQAHPARYGKLKDKTTGNWTVRSDTWIAYNRQFIGNVRVEMNQFGHLIPGYGGDPGQYHMGPELGFGWTVADAFNQKMRCCSHNKTQVLLIKVAWGGRSLAVDFRPPSSGGTTGLYYESMIANTFKTLSRLGELFPGYETNFGSYELAGFAWHQGWNDGCDEDMTSEYEFNLANLIRDIRSDLNVPYLPVSIGISGMHGYTPDTTRDAIIAAQLAVANATKYPEFDGTVASVETRSFHRQPPPYSPHNQGYHWNNNCEAYWLIGKAMGDAMVNLLSLNPKNRALSRSNSSS
jgi:Carbohydrate esterase, sialic acid-specific acetylesterase